MKSKDSSQTRSQARSAILLVHCQDRTGIVASVADFIRKNNGNILHLEQHVDGTSDVYVMRVEWSLTGFSIPVGEINDRFLNEVARPFGMHWQLYFSDEVPRMAVFVSKFSHCLHDILSRFQTNEWNVELPLIISNHPDLEPVATNLGIDFHVLPVTSSNKREQEQKQLSLLKEYKIDFIVLARYMQILTDDFVSHYPNRIINIHHSFLPAFPGAKPYHSAYARGVKIIGATSHYASAELDGGPIIEQDVVRVSHRDTVNDFIRQGRDLERIVLARAIWYHLNRKIHVYDNRTVVFS